MTAPTALLFTFRQIPVIAEMLSSRGFDPLAMLRAAGLPEDALKGEVTAPLFRVQEFIDRAAERLEAPLFGLDFADRIPRGTFGVSEFVVHAAPTVQAGLEALCECSPLINPLLDMRYVADQRGCEIRFSFAAQRDALGMHINEYTVSFISKQFALVLGTDLPLERAWFPHGRRTGAEAVAQRLGCNVAFQAPDCGFAVASEVIARQPSSANPALFAFLLAQARAQLGLVGKNDVIAQVVRVLEARLPSGDVSASTVAEAMATTQRSLQRHLAEAGTSFRDVVRRVRTRRRDELSRIGLADPEIATRLGFANVRSMRRSLEDAGPDPDPDAEPSGD